VTNRTAGGDRRTQRLKQDGLGSPRDVGWTPLIDGRSAQVHGVAVEAHAHGRVGREVEHRPRRRDHEPVAVIAERLGGGAAGFRRRNGSARGHEQRERGKRRKRLSGSESEQSTHPHITFTRRAGPHPAGQIVLADERATWSGAC
jgi:hypothetical protein